MQFRLIYQGPLGGQGTRDIAKHDIRRQFHPQIERLWTQRPLVNINYALSFPRPKPADGTYVEKGIYEDVQGFTICPLVTDGLALVAGLHVLLFRREEPGHLFSQSGDIDNRIKVLIDGLRMPSVDEIRRAGLDPAQEPSPLHCALKDDTLLTNIAVDTDRLLTDGAKEQVLAIVTITLKATVVTIDNYGIIG